MNEDYKLTQVKRYNHIAVYTTKEIDKEQLTEILKKRLGYFEKYTILCKKQEGLLHFVSKLRTSADQKVGKLFLVKLISDFTDNSFIGDNGENIFMTEEYCVQRYKGLVKCMATKRIVRATITDLKEIVKELEAFNYNIKRLAEEIKKEKSLEVEQPPKQ